jgi:DNA-directed RNA polymerase subunit RPC12/RpoP
MIEGARKMSCGNCGRQKFQVYQTPKKGLVVECEKCKSTTIVTVKKPEFHLDWGERSEGILSTGKEG